MALLHCHSEWTLYVPAVLNPWFAIGTVPSDLELRYALHCNDVQILELTRYAADKATGMVANPFAMNVSEPLPARHQFSSEKGADVYLKLPYLYEQSAELNIQSRMFNGLHVYWCKLAQSLVPRAELTVHSISFCSRLLVIERRRPTTCPVAKR